MGRTKIYFSQFRSFVSARLTQIGLFLFWQAWSFNASDESRRNMGQLFKVCRMNSRLKVSRIFRNDFWRWTSSGSHVPAVNELFKWSFIATTRSTCRDFFQLSQERHSTLLSRETWAAMSPHSSRLFEQGQRNYKSSKTVDTFNRFRRLQFHRPTGFADFQTILRSCLSTRLVDFLRHDLQIHSHATRNCYLKIIPNIAAAEHA